ncbi:MAG: hypothetical protein HOH34_09065 [Flavobacteriales bacterium]|nr:hypothetical protein [Flavobacteriales bacterium]
MIEKEFDKIKIAIAKAQEIASLGSSETALQSHGKLFGMDAFSWHNPNISVLEKTIESFPFRTVWLGNTSEISAYINSYDTDGKKLERYIVFGECEDIVKDQNHIEHFSNLTKSIDALKDYSFSPGVLLFTTSDSDSEYAMNYFSSLFLKLQ